MNSSHSGKKSRNFFEFRYVTFSSSNVSVDLNSFLSTEAGKTLIKGAVKRDVPKESSRMKIRGKLERTPASGKKVVAEFKEPQKESA